MSQDLPVDPYRSPAAPPPQRGRRPWAWIVAGTVWAMLSLAAVATIAVKTVNPLITAFATTSPSPRLSSATSAAPSVPSDPVTSITMSTTSSPLPSVPVTGTDPRPAAAAAWNAAMPFYGTNDMKHYCQIFAFGPRYMYRDLKECMDLNGPEAAKLSPSERTDAGDMRIKPDAMVVLADRSVAFRESDQYWPGHDDWVVEDQSVIVMRNVPHQGWRQVGYVDANKASDSFGYFPKGLS